MNQKRLAVIVPAYNEEASIAEVVTEINRIAEAHQLHIQVVVVNDCSKDRTSQIASSLSCIVLDLPINLGIGGAVQTGFKYAWEEGFDLALQIDGDGQHPAEAIPELIRFMETNKLDVVIGSRFLEKEGFQSSRVRRTGIRFFRALNRSLTGQDIRDTTSGFRLLNRRTIEVVKEYYPDEYPEPEALILYSRNELKAGEMPVIMRERQGGVSSINNLGAVYYMLKVTLAVIFSRIRT
jgi:glycosyltransferase involved in cell wall biosynthesis